MNAYYIRCHPADVPELLALGVMLGVLIEQDGTHVAATGMVWDVIGPIPRATGEADADGQPVMQPLSAPDGAPYWHANLNTPDSMSLLAHAQQLAADRPEIAQALAAVPRFFVADPATGTATAPRQPYRVLE